MYVSTKPLIHLRCAHGAIFMMALVFFLAVNATQAAAEIKYSVSILGISDAGLKGEVLDTSRLLEKSNRPVISMRVLRQRVEESLSRISVLLRAHGYYGATQKFDIKRKSENSAVVTAHVSLGPVYTIGNYDIRSTAPGEPRLAIDIPLKTLGMKAGEIARSEIIAAADVRLLETLGRQAYPLARIEKRRVVVDHKTKILSVEIFVAPGPYARFGSTRMEGLESIKPELIAHNVAWVRGQPFDSAALKDARTKLRQTGLFTSILVRHADKVADSGELEITVSVKERKHRSIGAGGSFSTTDGPLGKLFWEHRNLWGYGERLRIRGEAGAIRQGAFGDFRISNFGAREQDLVLDARLAKEQPDGYISTETAIAARLERRFSTIYAGSAGLGFDRSDIEENNTDRIFNFVTLPISLRRDVSDDLFDASRGGRDTITFTPNVGVLGTDANFIAMRLFDTVYLPIMAEKKLVFAGWARIGTIYGERNLDIPANKRLYSGGPGSVRGYALNAIGPLDSENDPIGGRSSTEFGAELRWRAFGPFGFVAFAEAGAVYDDPLPNWGEALQWGAGLGLRYLTKIGPIRLDVAVPLNRRNAVDDAFQILVSLGQAF